jgi:hypothetical protein
MITYLSVFVTDKAVDFVRTPAFIHPVSYADILLNVIMCSNRDGCTTGRVLVSDRKVHPCFIASVTKRIIMKCVWPLKSLP